MLVRSAVSVDISHFGYPLFDLRSGARYSRRVRAIVHEKKPLSLRAGAFLCGSAGLGFMQQDYSQCPAWSTTHFLPVTLFS